MADGRDFLFSNEYPMIRFLEQNGYDVSYVSGLDTHLDANLITKHKAFLSVGHDEYWSKEQRDHVLAARDAGTNLAFFSGNEVYWKTRWEESQDGSHTPNRTLVCYKDTWANTQIDPVTPTATWRDPRFGDLGHGPENSLTGTMYKANSVDLPIKVSSAEGKLRMWRNTSLDSLASGSTATLGSAHRRLRVRRGPRQRLPSRRSDQDVDHDWADAGVPHRLWQHRRSGHDHPPRHAVPRGQRRAGLLRWNVSSGHGVSTAITTATASRGPADATGDRQHPGRHGCPGHDHRDPASSQAQSRPIQHRRR